MRSKLAVLFIAIIYCLSFKQYSNYTGLLQGGGDSWGYYVYLPAAFIYHDLDDLRYTIGERARYSPHSVSNHEGHLKIEEAHAYKNKVVIKYTSGVAILYSPFFLAAHYYCKLSGSFPADGYAVPYNILISISSLVYALLGLILLRIFLLRYFSDIITTITLLCIALGTNLYFFSVLNCSMSHPYLFALYAALILASDNFYKRPDLKNALVIGFCCGMITLIRPTEIIAVFIPAFWNIFSWWDLKDRFQFIFTHRMYFFVILLMCVLVNLPQLVYWKTLTGKLFYYSYTNEGFNFLHPHLKRGLFGFANGWLPYTPIMIFALAGILLMSKYFRQAFVPLVIFLPIHIYIIYSWWCWQYINGFGSRPMIETYPLLAIPFACFITYISQKHFLNYLTGVSILFFIFLNLFQTWQFNKGLIWTEDSNWAFYKAIFLKTSSTKEALIAYDCGETQPSTSCIHFEKKLQENSFEDSLTTDYISSHSKSGKYAFLLHHGTTPEIKFIAENSGVHTGDYIRLSCWVYVNPGELEPDHYHSTVLAAAFKHNGNQIRWRIVRLQNKIGNTAHSMWHTGNTSQWEYVSFFVKVPHRFKTTSDEFSALCWNPGNKTILIDDLEVELWKKN